MNAPVRADLITNFEAPAYNGSSVGTDLSGQNGWYVPVAGSAPYNVHTYAGNALTLPANPSGGNQFIGAIGPGPAFARAQVDTSFAGLPNWTIAFDVAHRYNGVLPAAQNLASFSTQNPLSAPRQLIALHTWSDPATALNWNAGYNVADAAGTVATQSPGAAWNNLLLDNWYRESMTFDLSSNTVLSVSITNLTTGITNTANPVGWYLAGGITGNGLALPTAVRFFTGSGTPGNVAGFDNLSIVGAVPEPSSLVLVGAGVFGAFARRYRKRNKSEEVVA